jgi:hypothetical protein
MWKTRNASRILVEKLPRKWPLRRWEDNITIGLSLLLVDILLELSLQRNDKAIYNPKNVYILKHDATITLAG